MQRTGEGDDDDEGCEGLAAPLPPVEHPVPGHQRRHPRLVLLPLQLLQCLQHVSRDTCDTSVRTRDTLPDDTLPDDT